MLRLTTGVALVALAGAPGVAPAQVVTMTDDLDREEFVIEVGPIDLPAMPMHHGDGHGGVSPTPGIVHVPKAVSMFGFDYEIVDTSGAELPVRLLHHFNLVDPDHREWYLPIARRVLAIGQDTEPQSVPKQLLGLPLEAGQRLAVSATLMNMGHADITGVIVRVRLRYTTSELFPVFEFAPFHIDVAFPENDRDFDLPVGRSAYSWEGSPMSDGRLMGLGTHLHDHAESLVFEDLTDGDTIWTALATRRDDGTIDRSPVAHLYRKIGVGIRADHRYRVTVHYDNQTGAVITSGGMGLVAGVFIPDDEASFAADTTDALYRRDLEHFLQLDKPNP